MNGGKIVFDFVDESSIVGINMMVDLSGDLIVSVLVMELVVSDDFV